LQPSLFQPQDIEFDIPEGRDGPKLWIRRLSLWKDATTLLRDIKLREGVNIIWSPDLSTNDTGATPHGSGKSTFCRLIRYCLGERHFANEEQRPLMQYKLPDGFVGAEVMIDGECWVVTRPMGMNVPSRASKANSIEDTFPHLLQGTDPATIVNVVSDAFCADYRDQVPDNLNSSQVWDVILAWLTRDQECRLDDVFAWRSKRSGSGSPAQELALETKLAVVRLAIGALSANEVSASAEIRTLVRTRDSLKQTINQLDWLHKHSFEELAGQLSYDADRDPSDNTVRQELIDKANENLAKVTGATHQKGQAQATDIQGERTSLQRSRNEAFEKLTKAKALLDTLPDQISAKRGEQGTEQARLEGGTIVRCTICHVNIDTVRAEGCGISLERCDLNAVQGRIDQANETIGKMQEQLRTLPESIEELGREMARIDRDIEALDKEFVQREKEFSQSSNKVGEAREIVRQANWFNRKMVERDTEKNRLEKIEKKIEGLRESVGLERERATTAIGDLESVFQQLVASLMPSGCSGKIKLDGNGLHADILLERGVGLSTAAVESFKIVAFDLAAMILAVNDKAKLPSLLIHDSPREADLDADIYSNLFDFVLGLEGKATPAPFQYIITTTTAPSQAAIEHDALRARLSSTPAEHRLFAMDF